MSTTITIDKFKINDYVQAVSERVEDVKLIDIIVPFTVENEEGTYTAGLSVLGQDTDIVFFTGDKTTAREYAEGLSEIVSEYGSGSAQKLKAVNNSTKMRVPGSVNLLKRALHISEYGEIQRDNPELIAEDEKLSEKARENGVLFRIYNEPDPLEEETNPLLNDPLFREYVNDNPAVLDIVNMNKNTRDVATWEDLSVIRNILKEYEPEPSKDNGFGLDISDFIAEDE